MLDRLGCAALSLALVTIRHLSLHSPLTITLVFSSEYYLHLRVPADTEPTQPQVILHSFHASAQYQYGTIYNPCQVKKSRQFLAMPRAGVGVRSSVLVQRLVPTLLTDCALIASYCAPSIGCAAIAGCVCSKLMAALRCI